MSLFPLIGNQVALSTSAPVATDNYCNGVLISTGGVARAATSGGAQYSQGFLMSNTGQVIYTDATAGLPGGTTYSEGIPQTSTGAICISTDAPATWSNGLPFALNGALSALVSVLELDFLSGALDSRITFARADATTCATFFGTDGLLKTAAPNVARFDNDPATLRPLGLLIEEQRTNLLLHSRDQTQAAWSKTDVTPTRNQVGIDGTANSACLMTEGSAGTAFVAQNVSAVAAGSTLTGSIVMKRGNTDWVRVFVGETSSTDGGLCWVNLATGAKGTVQGFGAGTNNSCTVTNLGGGWYRIALTSLPNGTYTIPRMYWHSASADASATRVDGATYIVDCAQLEVGSFATSIITTGTATVTRAADSASMTGANFSSWYNQTAGTFVVEHDYIANPNADSQVFAATDAAVANMLGARRPGSGQQTILQRTPTNIDIILAAASANVVTKIANSYDGVGTSGVLNGTAAVTAGAWTPTNLDRIFLGHRNAVSQLNGHIRRLTYYPVRLGNSQLQALTL